MRYSRKLVILFLLPVLGCISSELYVFKRTITDTSPGLVYYLPVVRFKIEVTYQLQKCTYDADAGGLKIQLKPVVKVVSDARPDLGAMYTINYEKLNSAFNTTSLSIEFYENGSLKSVNASLDDQSGEAIESVLTTLGEIISIWLPWDGISQPKTEDFCKDTATRAIARIAPLKKTIEDLEISVQSLKEKMESARDSYLPSTSDENARREMFQLENDFNYMGHRLRIRKEELSILLNKTLGIKQELIFEPSEKNTSATIKLPTHLLKKHLTDTALLEICGSATAEYCEQDGLNLRITLESSRLSSGPAPSDGNVGLVLRLPTIGKLRICRASCDIASQILYDKEVELPQFGFYSRLTLTNYLFDKTNLSLELSKTGAITSFSYDSIAHSSRQLEALQEAVKLYKQFRTASDAQRAARQDIRLNNLEAEISRVQRLNDLLQGSVESTTEE